MPGVAVTTECPTCHGPWLTEVRHDDAHRQTKVWMEHRSRYAIQRITDDALAQTAGDVLSTAIRCCTREVAEGAGCLEFDDPRRGWPWRDPILGAFANPA